MLSCSARPPPPTSYAARQRMRSLAPLASEMVPPPDHDPDRDANGPAPWAWACAASSKNPSANAAPRQARPPDGIDRDGMVFPWSAASERRGGFGWRTSALQQRMSCPSLYRG